MKKLFIYLLIFSLFTISCSGVKYIQKQESNSQYLNNHFSDWNARVYTYTAAGVIQATDVQIGAQLTHFVKGTTGDTLSYPNYSIDKIEFYKKSFVNPGQILGLLSFAGGIAILTTSSKCTGGSTVACSLRESFSTMAAIGMLIGGASTFSYFTIIYKNYYEVGF